MNMMAPIPPGDHKVNIEKIKTDEGVTRFLLTCACDWEVTVEATPASSGKPDLWARNQKSRHIIIVGGNKNYIRGDMEND